MKRRTFLSLAAASLALGGAEVSIAGGGHVEYSKEAYQQARADGKAVLVDFYAPW